MGARPSGRPARRAAGYLLAGPLVLVLVSPLLVLLALSFARQAGLAIDPAPSLANYRRLFALSDTAVTWLGIPFPLRYPLPAVLLLKSLMIALAVTASVILLAYPMAYFLAFRVTRRKTLWLILLTIPFWTSYLLRVFAWKVVLGFNGAINSGLWSLGVIARPLEFLLYNPVAVVITLTHAWVATAVLPLYVSLDKIDRSLLEAATDLGDGGWRRLRRVTLPLSSPGVTAAALLIFIPTVGDYVTPTLVGGPGGAMIGNLIQNLFFKENDAPLGAAVSVAMMSVVALISLGFLWSLNHRGMRRRRAAA